MWDSRMCGKVACWIMEIEEEEMVPFNLFDPNSTNSIVPDEKRVMIREVLFDLQKREATIRCGKRGVVPGEFDEKARESFISW